METALITSSVVLWLLILLNLLFTLALVRRVNSMASTSSQRRTPEMGLSKGATAPNFTAQTLNGETVTLQNYLGKSTVFVFFSTRCQPCHEILPRLNSLKEGATQAGVNLLLVSIDTMEDTRPYIEQNQIHLPVLVAPRVDNTFASEYKATGTPAYCHLSAEGRVLSAGVAYLEAGVWKDFVAMWSRSSYEDIMPGERR